MRIFKFLTVIFLILVVVFFIGGWLIPDAWTVSRSTIIHGNTKKIYAYLSDFKQWEKWSPWNDSKDPSLKYTYEGPRIGTGAKQRWTSEKMGSGWMQLTSANPKKGVAYNLFIDMNGMKSTLHGTIEFVQNEDETEITWTDKGNSEKSLFRRWMSLIVKPMLGRDIEQGLRGLKAIVGNN